MNKWDVLFLLSAAAISALCLWAFLTAPKPDGDWRLCVVFLLFPGLPLIGRTLMWFEKGRPRGRW